jgi:hypothetical protein
MMMMKIMMMVKIKVDADIYNDYHLWMCIMTQLFNSYTRLHRYVAHLRSLMDVSQNVTQIVVSRRLYPDLYEGELAECLAIKQEKIINMFIMFICLNSRQVIRCYRYTLLRDKNLHCALQIL